MSKAIQDWVQRNETKFENEDQKQHLMDYLEDQWGEKQSINFSFEQCLEKVKEWEQGFTKKVPEGNTEEVYSFDDGHYIVKLLDDDSKNFEGSMMKNCVGSKRYKFLQGLYSLRSKKGISRATFRVGEDKNLKEIKGKANTPLKVKYQKYVLEFLIEKEVSFREIDFNFWDISKIDFNLHEWFDDVIEEKIGSKVFVRQDTFWKLKKAVPPEDVHRFSFIAKNGNCIELTEQIFLAKFARGDQTYLWNFSTNLFKQSPKRALALLLACGGESSFTTLCRDLLAMGFVYEAIEIMKRFKSNMPSYVDEFLVHLKETKDIIMFLKFLDEYLEEVENSAQVDSFKIIDIKKNIYVDLEMNAEVVDFIRSRPRLLLKSRMLFYLLAKGKLEEVQYLMNQGFNLFDKDDFLVEIEEEEDLDHLVKMIKYHFKVDWRYDAVKFLIDQGFKVSASRLDWLYECFHTLKVQNQMNIYYLLWIQFQEEQKELLRQASPSLTEEQLQELVKNLGFTNHRLR